MIQLLVGLALGIMFLGTFCIVFLLAFADLESWRTRISLITSFVIIAAGLMMLVYL